MSGLTSTSAQEGRFPPPPVALADSAPAVLLTTSAVSGGVAEYLREQELAFTSPLVEVDKVNFDDSAGFSGHSPHNGTALLQYTSGSTRQPAGVMVSHRTWSRTSNR